MPTKYCVYMHRLKSDGRVYIGQSCDPQKRWHGHGSNYKHNTVFWSAIQEYGWDNFSHEILASELSKEEANELEEKYIERFDSTNPLHGFNRCKRGYTNGIVSDEARYKMSKSHTDRKHTDETKRKIGIGNKGKTVSEETRKRMSLAQKGHPTSEKHRKNIINAMKPHMRPVICVETGVVYDGIREAERKTGIKHQSIGACLSGLQKVTHGCHWKYYDGEVV